MNICKNCKYPRRHISSYMCSKNKECSNPDPVSGNIETFYTTFCFSKNEDGNCKDYEPIGSIRKFIRFFTWL